MKILHSQRLKNDRNKFVSLFEIACLHRKLAVKQKIKKKKKEKIREPMRNFFLSKTGGKIKLIREGFLKS